MNDYRFYHCYQRPSSVVCYPVKDENVPSEPNSRLLFVSNYIPKVLDIVILNYRYYTTVEINQ